MRGVSAQRVMVVLWIGGSGCILEGQWNAQRACSVSQPCAPGYTCDIARSVCVAGGLDVGLERGLDQPRDWSVPPPPDWPLHTDGPLCIMGPNGVPINAGCDLEIQTGGVTATAGLTSRGQIVWHIVKGKKYWLLEPKGFGRGRFAGGGADVAAYFRAFDPGCTVTTSDGLYLNPGCNTVVMNNGVTGLGSITDSGKTYWEVFFRKNYWRFDPAASGGTGAFVDGGKDPIVRYAAFGTCTDPVDPVSGLFKNPGCDLAVKLAGITAVGEFIAPSPPPGQPVPHTLVLSGKKFWILSFNPPVLVNAGDDVAVFFRTYAPTTCGTQQTTDGLDLNPGCDPDVQAGGVDAMDGLPPGGVTTFWQVTRGRKFWNFDPMANGGKGAWFEGGKDISVYYRSFDSP